MIARSNDELIDHLIDSNALHSQNIIEAFRRTDRADFVLDPSAADVYDDHPHSIGFKQTISQPTTVAMMMEMLEPCEGEKVLDVGSGSGWTSAILGTIVGESGSVIGVERVRELVRFGEKNLKKYSLKNTTIVLASDTLGIKGEKFDRILVSAAADELPQDLIKQLRIGGKLVIPVRDYIYEVRKLNELNISLKKHYGFVFVPLVY